MNDRAKTARYPNFDLLRLLLALQVMLTHYSTQEGLRWRIVYAANSVAAFLAISGFLILESFERSPSWSRFAWKRLCRVAPGFLAAIFLTYCLFPNHLSGTLLCYVTAGLVGQPFSANAPLWSLMLEEILYGMLAIGVSIGAYKAKWPLWVWIIAIIYVMPHCGRFSPEAGRIAGVAIAFPIGSLIYIYRKKFEQIPGSYWAAMLALCVSLNLLRAVNSEVSSLFCTVSGSIVAVGFGAWGPPLPRPKWDLSYGIYIYHWPLFMLLGPFGIPAPIMLAIPTVLAAASWVLIERRALAWKNAAWIDLKRKIWHTGHTAITDTSRAPELEIAD